MAKNTTPYLLRTDTIPTRVTFTSADTTKVKDICSAGTEGSYLYEIAITNTEATSRDITLYLYDGSNDIPIKLSTVAANQGNIITTPDPLILIQPVIGFIAGRLLDRDQNYYLQLPTNYKIRMKVNTSLTSGTITVLTRLKDF